MRLGGLSRIGRAEPQARRVSHEHSSHRCVLDEPADRPDAEDVSTAVLKSPGHPARDPGYWVRRSTHNVAAADARPSFQLPNQVEASEEVTMDAMKLRRRNLRLPWRDHAGAAANWLDCPRRHPTERARHRRRLPGHSVRSQTRAEGRSCMMRATMSNEVVCANCGERFTAPAHSGRYRQTSERRIKSARYCSAHVGRPPM
jgi:hypothetical protein